MSNTLATWLNKQIDATGWSIREFGRRAGISHTHAARILNAEVVPSAEICGQIAKVFKIAPETIFSMAGLLPDHTENTEARREAMYLFDQLDEETQKTFITILRGYVRETAPPYNTKPSTP